MYHLMSLSVLQCSKELQELIIERRKNNTNKGATEMIEKFISLLTLILDNVGYIYLIDYINIVLVIIYV